MMSRRDYLLRKAVKSNVNTDWDEHKKCRNITKMIRNEKQAYCKQSVSDNVGDSKKIWKVLHNILPRKASASPSSLSVDGKVCTDVNDIANSFNEHFTGIAAKLVEDNNGMNSGIYKWIKSVSF